MDPVAKKRAGRLKRHRRIRKMVFGTEGRPRLCVSRSLRHISAQIINDEKGHTLAAVSTLSQEVRTQIRGKKKSEAATMVGTLLAQKARAVGLTRVVFDRGGYRFHGRVKALAAGAREAGLQF